jgi:DNA-binding NarL/FixJ family response regulator
VATSGIDVILFYDTANDSTVPEITALAQHARVILILPGEQREQALTAIRLGARGVVFKRLAIDALVSAIDAVTAGHVWIPTALQASIVAGMREPTVTDLTSREREVTRLVARGLRNAEIASRLHISEQTVKTHLNNVFHKLELRDRVELCLYATRNGIVDVHDDFGGPRGRPTRSAA